MGLSSGSRRAAAVAAVAAAALAAALVWSSRTEERAPARAGVPAVAPAPAARDGAGRRTGVAAPRSDEYPWIGAAELESRLEGAEDIVVLNTRAAPGEPLIVGAIEVAEEEVDRWAESASKATPIVTYCSCPNDAASVRAALALQRLGFTDVHVLEGGLSAWQAAGFATEPAPQRGRRR